MRPRRPRPVLKRGAPAAPAASIHPPSDRLSLRFDARPRLPGAETIELLPDQRWVWLLRPADFRRKQSFPHSSEHRYEPASLPPVTSPLLQLTSAFCHPCALGLNVASLVIPFHSEIKRSLTCTSRRARRGPARRADDGSCSTAQGLRPDGNGGEVSPLPVPLDGPAARKPPWMFAHAGQTCPCGEHRLGHWRGA